MSRLRGLPTAAEPERHAFVSRPHRTLFSLSLPLLISLIAEPLTGLADTIFIARLGATELAALGVATVLLSGVFWVFNFLGIGTQTEVARATGAGSIDQAQQVCTVAVALAAVLGVGLAVGSWPWLEGVSAWMGASEEMRQGAVAYLQIRLLGGPGTLIMVASFGALLLTLEQKASSP